MTQTEISFVTPLFNCIGHTREYLRTLAETAPNVAYEVVLVDDLSTDGTRDFLKDLGNPPYRVFMNQSNEGFAKSSNIGARHAKGRYLCFLNNDVLLRPGWLEPMYELVRSGPDVGAVGNIQVEPGSGLVHHAGVFFDWDGRPLHAWRYRRRRPRGDFGEWNAITAACLIMRARTFREMGGFDENYRNGFEDIDLCVRLRLKNYRLLVSYRSVIEHYASVSPGRKKYDDENREKFLYKWRPVTRAWGKREWPAQYVHRYAGKWWKMVPWRMAQAIFILAFRSVVRRER